MCRFQFVMPALVSFVIVISLYSCKENKPKIDVAESTSNQLSKDDFTLAEDIDPNIYFATEENKAIDPNDQLMEVFRKKKAADMADPTKPRPLPPEEISQLENVSAEQEWGDIKDVFQFDWSKIEDERIASLTATIKARKIFDNADLKVVELVIAAGAIMPMHAQATPAVYFVLDGEGEITVGDKTSQVYTGTSIKSDSYEQKRVEVTGQKPLKLLWFSWAPEGDESYLQSGYYLTGSNLHVQSQNGVLPEQFYFWDAEIEKTFKLKSADASLSETEDEFIKSQIEAWNQAEKDRFYPDVPAFRSANQVDWVDVMKMDPKSFFFAKDLTSLGSTLDMMSRLAKIKSVFRVNRPDSGYDLNYSYLAWGPQSKYIAHSHAICEFYYVLEGDVEYIIDEERFRAQPGNFYFHPPYYDHEMRGLKEGVPFLSISGTWVPYGRRELFEEPMFLLEDPEVLDDLTFSDDFDFHDFGMKRGQVYGDL